MTGLSLDSDSLGFRARVRVVRVKRPIASSQFRIPHIWSFPVNVLWCPNGPRPLQSDPAISGRGPALAANSLRRRKEEAYTAQAGGPSEIPAHLLIELC